MTSSSTFLQRLLSRTSSPSKAAAQRAVTGAPDTSGASSRPAPALEIFFLLDKPDRVDLQLTLASVDSLVSFHQGDAPLAITVLHRVEPSVEVLDIFDSAPGLNFRHLHFAQLADADADADADAGEKLDYFWRDYATLILARVVKAPYYLVLDSSCVCIRPLKSNVFFEDGKAVSQWEPIDQHPDCLDGARQLLHPESLPEQGLSTLPVILSVPLALKTLSRLEAVAAKSAEAVLQEAAASYLPWSANSLYSCAAAEELPRYHRPALFEQQLRALHSDINVWDESTDPDDWNPLGWIRLTTHGQFLVVKSNGGQRARVLASRCYATFGI